MLNRVVLVGRLTRDPELRVSQNNIAVATFNLAVNRPFTSQNGERGADFINCVVFRKQAENVNQYVKKGSLVGIDGRIQTRNYENKDGQRVYVTEVVCESVQFLEPKGSSNQSQSNNDYNNSADSYTNAYSSGNQSTGQGQSRQQPVEDNPFANSKGPVDISDDDLPF
ncbi:single-stranded DNA-binding protein [Jeotgalicoccus meleagridis]|jgi:single-strand DNA-binding protein|uniref:Single-stranded DNA-binding protein n=1 Tax=Jeotgalicoccus meleagridis TaxID=2759181 RepID=A0A6V7R3U9_9STAP|nr:single-stranded DNA-binding protein [Jeotgalicoccus meleagridis]CAD2071733.1 Single-stranded DNA-binding protein ssb [Jeotgalicoccus meleagridis]HIW37869.1 single-stranded DNA-binding protein [Candidatus Jeotgalicoccus stercoravium]